MHTYYCSGQDGEVPASIKAFSLIRLHLPRAVCRDFKVKRVTFHEVAVALRSRALLCTHTEHILDKTRLCTSERKGETSCESSVLSTASKQGDTRTLGAMLLRSIPLTVVTPSRVSSCPNSSNRTHEVRAILRIALCLDKADNPEEQRVSVV